MPMKTGLTFVTIVATCCAALPALASDNTAPRSQAAAGLALAWNSRADYGANTFQRFSPEAVGVLYIPVMNNVFARPGARMGASVAQPEMPLAVRVEESDVWATAEIGVLYDWMVVPSVSLGLGVDYRSIEFVEDKPVSSSSEKISTTETLPYMTIQAGVGLPVLRGAVLVEPFARYVTMPGDDRVGLGYGIDVTATLW